MTETIGILGGMGPMVSVDFMQKIIQLTPATIDQEHIKIILNHNPKIPSRIEAITKNGPSPLPELIKSAHTLQKAGVDFIIMPCHTVHIWFDELRATIQTPIYSMVENTVSSLLEENKKINGHKGTLLLATEATVQKQLYQQAFRSKGLPLTVPTRAEQKIISSSIRQAKAGKIKDNPDLEALNQMINHYKKKDVTRILAGCTEISLLYPYLKANIEKIDPTYLLAKFVVEKVMSTES